MANTEQSTVNQLPFFQDNKHTLETHFLKYKVTYSLIAILISIYFVSSFPYFESTGFYYIAQGALVPNRIIEFQFWRFLTANLLHINFDHMFFNCLSILIWGHLLEKHIGSKALLWLVFFAGFMTTAFSFTFSPNSISLGASGIAYGLMFGFVVYAVLSSIALDPEQFSEQFLGLIIFTIIQIMYNYFGPSNLDVWGHFGGSIAGVFFISVLLIEAGIITKTNSATLHNLQVAKDV